MSQRDSIDRFMRNATPEEARRYTDALTWREDTVVTNYDGERVWLKPCVDAEGRRIGITDCCLEANPCPVHGGNADEARAKEGGHEAV